MLGYESIDLDWHQQAAGVTADAATSGCTSDCSTCPLRKSCPGASVGAATIEYASATPMLGLREQADGGFDREARRMVEHAAPHDESDDLTRLVKAILDLSHIDDVPHLVMRLG